jgi:hypothetical protein
MYTSVCNPYSFSARSPLPSSFPTPSHDRLRKKLSPSFDTEFLTLMGYPHTITCTHPPLSAVNSTSRSFGPNSILSGEAEHQWGGRRKCTSWASRDSPRECCFVTTRKVRDVNACIGAARRACPCERGKDARVPLECVKVRVCSPGPAWDKSLCHRCQIRGSAGRPPRE